MINGRGNRRGLDVLGFGTCLRREHLEGVNGGKRSVRIRRNEWAHVWLSRGLTATAGRAALSRHDALTSSASAEPGRGAGLGGPLRNDVSCVAGMGRVVGDMGNVKFCVDSSLEGTGCWLKYVRTAPTFEEQNLAVCHLSGEQSLLTGKAEPTEAGSVNCGDEHQ
ncbi:hypothetical protein JZ751_014931 [Albula glossodonta]|uniref:Uncharacterized protein n=1 Tax=Albula glossodonta TaxID=121402 RepID=A0A8T2N572_9TELE|nr:hypothetical protein JZ751_014931 [Albula glossodonta]